MSFFSSILHLPGVGKVVKHLVPISGDDMNPEDQATEARIQRVLDTDPDLVNAKRAGASASQLEGLLRQKMPSDFANWRLRESDSTSSGYRPTQAVSKKKGAAYTAAGAGGGFAAAAALPAVLGATGAAGAAGGGGAAATGAGTVGSMAGLGAGTVGSTAASAGGLLGGMTGSQLLLRGGLAAAGAAGDIYAAHRQSSSVDKATDATVRAKELELQYLREKDAQEAADAARVEAENDRRFNQSEDERRAEYDARESRLTPFRQLGTDASNTLGGMLGLSSGGGTYQPQPYVPAYRRPATGSAAGAASAGGGAPSASLEQAASIVTPLFSSLQPTSAAIDPILKALNAKGINATRAVHGVNGSLPSDDKIIIDGTVVDLIGDVGGPGAKFMWGPQLGGGSAPAPSTAMPRPTQTYGANTLGTMVQPTYRAEPAAATPLFTLKDFLNVRQAPRYASRQV
jgi:hypothetical protein